MNYRPACTNCGESNYHTIGDIAFITGRTGIHVCNNCGFQAGQFPKISAVESDMLKKRFSRKPQHFFKEETGSSNTYFFILMFAIVAVLGFLTVFQKI